MTNSNRNRTSLIRTSLLSFPVNRSVGASENTFKMVASGLLIVATREKKPCFLQLLLRTNCAKTAVHLWIWKTHRLPRATEFSFLARVSLQAFHSSVTGTLVLNLSGKDKMLNGSSDDHRSHCVVQTCTNSNCLHSLPWKSQQGLFYAFLHPCPSLHLQFCGHHINFSKVSFQLQFPHSNIHRFLIL